MNDADEKQLLSYLQKAKHKAINRIYLHWSAGSYTQVFDDYHINVKGDGEIYFTTDDLSQLKAHTYRRNSNAIGIALSCAKDGIFPRDLGPYPPTQVQIEHTTQMLAIICRELEIPIDIKHVMTHAEAADNMDGVYAHAPYGPKNGCERWDLYELQDYDGQWKSGGQILRGKAMWYQAQVKEK